MRRYDRRMIVPFRIVRALVAAAAIASLAGCAGGTSSADIAPTAAPPPIEPAPQSSVQQQPLAPPPAAGGRTRQAAPAAPPPAPAPQAALTPEEISAQCWMKFENDRRAKSIDARAELVDKCIKETSRNQPPAR